ncbi:50S ribosomal protein L21 [Candidatus Peregrinibacteria bacterium]|nr:50S ribosomal protein L21 [Candidatus Peregrinibacteria bacterium]
MFAIIETGGKQYKVEKGTTFSVEKLDLKEGGSITIDKVVLIGDNAHLKIGTPFVEGASVTAKVLAHEKGEKLRIFKMKAKDHYQRTQGHRQKYTSLEITEIKGEGATKVAAAKKAPVQKTTKKAKVEA